MPATGRYAPRAGYFGHLTRISNKLIQMGNDEIQKHLQVSYKFKIPPILKLMAVPASYIYLRCIDYSNKTFDLCLVR